MGRKIALGTGLSSAGMALVTTPTTVEEKLYILQKQVEDLTKAFHAVNSIRIKDKRQQEMYKEAPLVNANKDGIPIGLSLMGSSIKGDRKSVV